MKNIFKKNQMMIAVLALMIAVAGYLNFTGGDMKVDQPDVASGEAGGGETVDVNAMDVGSGYYDGAVGNMDDALISANVDDSIDEAAGKKEKDKDDTSEANDVVVNDAVAKGNDDSSDGVNTDEIGETVLTSAAVMDNFLSQAKLNREQVRAKAKEILNGIIENETLSEDAKADAVKQLVALTDAMQKESQAEQQLGIKGFTNAIVSISENSVDVCIAKNKISEVEKAQIEDIVMRKTGCEIENIVITTMGSTK